MGLGEPDQSTNETSSVLYWEDYIEFLFLGLMVGRAGFEPATN